MNKEEVLRALEGFQAEKMAQYKANYLPEQAQDDLDTLDKIYDYVLKSK